LPVALLLVLAAGASNKGGDQAAAIPPVGPHPLR